MASTPAEGFGYSAVIWQSYPCCGLMTPSRVVLHESAAPAKMSKKKRPTGWKAAMKTPLCQTPFHTYAPRESQSQSRPCGAAVEWMAFGSDADSWPRFDPPWSRARVVTWYTGKAQYNHWPKGARSKKKAPENGANRSSLPWQSATAKKDSPTGLVPPCPDCGSFLLWRATYREPNHGLNSSDEC